MKETIYTIPISNAMQEKCGCPICKIYKFLEKNEIEIILGASMMEPDIRIKTNKSGFCTKHLNALIKENKRLPLSLMLQSHFLEIASNMKNKKPDKQILYLEKMINDCYICNKINNYKEKLYITLFDMYAESIEFKEVFLSQEMFCFEHYIELVKLAPKRLSKKYLTMFYGDIEKINNSYFTELTQDLNWFIKKFDYRNEEEPWENSKDSVERAIYLLSSGKS